MTIYDAPLATRTTDPVGLRLRLTAAVRGKSISELVDAALDRDLPSNKALASELEQEETTTDEQH
jgi:hypothetical protein